MILRNLTDNPNLVYATVRAHKGFEDLGTFTLARGLREIRRKQQAKEERARQESGADKGKQRAGIDLEEGPHEEKARVLRNEQNNSVDLPSNTESNETLPETSEPSGDRPIPPSVPTSPTSATTPRVPSEKARGKMRAGRSLSGDMTGSLERLASAGVGRNGFVPTQEWVSTSHLSDYTYTMLTSLIPGNLLATRVSRPLLINPGTDS